ncbi:uncharacterized protein LOC123539931 [Mercenaria mercenaria]|uniref:uncharacterized protein LOC123539931 n=1 Tax=Mercenaria mercenaria TaxID=6596 RepID=UPI00234F8FEF|nr:uncharacterized protein LOC123539931 [Mercenaria mercenaria]
MLNVCCYIMIYPKVLKLPPLISVLLSGLFKDCYVYGNTCYYLHNQLYTFHKQQCEHGCCSDYGHVEDICCAAEIWTASTTVGVTLGCVAVVIILVAIGIKIWFTIKKKSKQGVEPQFNDNASVRLQLNNNPMGSTRSVSALSQHGNDFPPPYSPSQSPRPPTRFSQTSPIELTVLSDPKQMRKLSPQPPPYTSTTQTLRPSPRVGGRLSPQVYSFQPSPARNLAPSRAW